MPVKNGRAVLYSYNRRRAVMHDFLNIPPELWIGVFAATVFGFALLIVHHWVRKGIAGELTRDVGIAFLVSAIVSVGYEFSTRNLEERKTLLDGIDRAMAESLPDNAWKEVRQEILGRPVVRRNVQIEFSLSHEAPLPDGRHVPVRNGQAVLTMTYAYDLYSLMSSGTHIEVSHALDYQPMFDPALALPRFASAVIREPGVAPRYYCSGDKTLTGDGHGGLTLSEIHMPPFRANEAVHVETKRYELVNVPGYYQLVMRELTTRGDDKHAHTVKVVAKNMPPDIDAAVITYYDPHTFRLDGNNTWVLDETLLPGQGFNLVFKPHTVPTLSAAAH
jgi:hypothetical protein